MTPDGRFLYATDESDKLIRAWSIGTDGTPTLLTCTPASNCQFSAMPLGIAIDPSSSHLFVAVFGAGKLAPFSIAADGSVTPVACLGTNCNAGAEPASLVVSPDQAPIAAFTSTVATAGHASAFDAQTSTASAGRSLARYDWDYGDGSTAENSGATPTHTYANAGTYTVTLTVTDDIGCSTTRKFTGQTVSCDGGPSATASRQITIAPPPSPPAPVRTLTVAVSGPGTVAGSGISCPGICTGTFADGTGVTLSASPASGATFADWSGDCSGAGTCTLMMGADHAVTATFKNKSPGPPKPKSPDTKITKAKFNARKRGATFTFTAVGGSTGFQCALVSRKQRRSPLRFKRCRSPKVYTHLRAGTYVFEVRAVAPSGVDPSPAKMSFTIGS